MEQRERGSSSIRGKHHEAASEKVGMRERERRGEGGGGGISEKVAQHVRLDLLDKDVVTTTCCSTLHSLSNTHRRHKVGSGRRLVSLGSGAK